MENKSISLNVRVTPDMDKKLDHYANRIGIDKSQLVRNMLTVEMDELAMMEKLGVLWVAASVRGIREYMKANHEQPPLFTP